MAEFVLTPEQQEALAAGTPLLILAGAGTGKTTVVTHRIANLIASGGARPGEVLALTFADKAAAEMGERLASLMEQKGFGDAGREVTCRTFHGFGADVVREYAPLLGMNASLKVLTTPESWQLLSRVVDSLDFRSIELPMGSLGGFLNGLLGFFSTAKDHLVEPDALDSFIASEQARLPILSDAAAEYRGGRLKALRDVAAAYRAYEDAKRERGFLDYGDLLLLPVRLLRAHSDVRDGYRRRFRHLFVDEYQDTNYSQRTLLMELLGPEARVVVIGDDDQSIYGWRGAVIRNILDFPKEPAIAVAGPTERHLEINRRSGAPILDIANAIISPLEERYPKTLRYMENAPTAEAGHYVAATDRSEARWIAETVTRLHGSPGVEDPTGRKRGYGVFAVLCRKRSLFQPVARAMEEMKIPYELIGGSGFYGRWEVRDVLSYMRVLADPADNIALARVLQSRSWRLSDRDLFHLSEWAQRQARRSRSAQDDAEEIPFRLIDALAHHDQVPGLGPDARARLARLTAMLDSVAREAPLTPLGRLIDRVIDDAGYRRELSARPDFDSHLALLNLGKLVELAREFEGDGDSLDAFVEYVQYALESGGEEAEVLAVDEASDAVKIMTIHQSKGLEFPAVFIPGLAAKLFPNTRLDNPDRWDQFPPELRIDAGVGAGRCAGPPSIDLFSITNRKQLTLALDERNELLRSEALVEERRLFYVAITRAQRALYFSRASWYGTNTKPRDASPFWDEVIDTGLTVSLGEEPATEVNPTLLSGSGRAAQIRNSADKLERLLMRPEEANAWIETVAAASPAEWAEAKARADAVLSVAAFRPSPRQAAGAVDISCSGLIQYARCPRLYRFCYVDRLPQRPAPWASAGTEVHRLIEQLSREPSEPRMESEEEPEVDPDEREHPHPAGHAPEIDTLLEVYRRSPFGRRRAALVEEPFVLALAGNLLRGRIDRLDRLPDGSWLLADFKASRYHGQLLDRQRLQLRLYALAACRLWDVDPRRLDCQMLFLVDGHLETMTFSTPELIEAEAWATDQLRFIQEGRFPPAGNPESCAACDYSHLCRT